MATWNFKSIDIMHLTKDTMRGQLNQTQINTVVNNLATYGVSHITIVCPLDEDTDYPLPQPTPGYVQKWLTAIRAAGLKVFWRGTWNYFEGNYGATPIRTPNTTPAIPIGTYAGVVGGTDTTSYLYKTWNFIKTHSSYFQSGDAWGPMPEPENRGANGNPGEMFSSYNQLGQWLVDLKKVSDNAFENTLGYSHEAILTGMTSVNGGTIISNLNTPTYWSQIGRVCIDHYVIPSQYSSDLDTIHTNSGVDVYFGEVGTTQSVGSPTTDPIRAALISSLFTTFSSKDYVKGINYFQAVGGSGAGSTENVLDYTNYAVLPSCQATFLNFYAPPVTTPLHSQVHRSGFVYTNGTHFELDGKKWVPFGCTIYDALFATHKNTDLLTKLDFVKASGYNTIRFTNFMRQDSATGAEFDENVYVYIDYVLDQCRKRGIKVVFETTDIGTISGHRGFTHGDANCLALFDSFFTWLGARVNTVNGLTYSQDSTIWAFSLWGEFGEASTVGGNRAMFDAISTSAKTAFPYTLVCPGGHKPEQIVDSSYGYTNYPPDDQATIPNVDFVATEPYYTQQNMLDLFPSLQSYTVANDIPWMSMEFGYNQSVSGQTDAVRAEEFRFIYEQGSKYGCEGFIFWNHDAGVAGGFGVNVNTPLTYAVTREYAISLQDKNPFVKAVGNRFVLNGSRFRYIGFNKYTLQISSLPQSTLADYFRAARNHGVRVMRTWCFDVNNPKRDSNGNLQNTNFPTNVLGDFRYLTTTALGANILPNGGFETNAVGWSADPDFTRSSVDAHSGTWSIAQNSSGGFQNFTTLNDATGITVTPNTYYNVSFYYKLSVTGNGPIFAVNAGSAYGNTIASGFLPGTGGQWFQGGVRFNSGSNTKVWIRLFNNGGTVTGFYDDFTLTTGGDPVLAWVEATLAHLDLVLDEARKHGIKLVLSLFDSNNYQGAAYPSKITYDNWANQIYGLSLNTGDNRTNTSTDFFRSPFPRQLLKDFVYGLVNRMNTINGRRYGDDPTIMTWELGNETRFDSDAHEIGNGNTANAVSVGWILDWARDISSYIKSIDPNHLVSFSGGEFMPTKVFSSDGAHSFELGIDRGVAGDHVYVGSYNGIDYKQLAQIPTLDYISFHSYPNQGLGSGDIHPYGLALGYVYSQRAEGYKAQIRAFIADVKLAGKPVTFDEIGYAREDTGTFPGWPMYPRIYAFKNLFKEVFDNDGDGVIIWDSTVTSGGSFSVGMDEVGKTQYWGTNENSNDSVLMHDINNLNTQVVDSGKRARAV